MWFRLFNSCFLNGLSKCANVDVITLLLSINILPSEWFMSTYLLTHALIQMRVGGGGAGVAQVLTWGLHDILKKKEGGCLKPLCPGPIRERDG